MEDSINTNKVFCLGDGYAHGHIWPEWPQILQALRPDLDVTVISAVGAGHEFLISELLTKDINNSLVIFQWPEHSRFDKLLQDSTWDNTIKSDPVYDFNTYNTHQGTWWCSSASKTDTVRNYHNLYVQSCQSRLREQNQKILVECYVNHRAKYVCTSNAEQDHFAKHSGFSHHRGTQIQPAPLLHYFWLMEIILPSAGILIDPVVSHTLQTRMQAHQWVPYDPDRDEIWATMSQI